jgi:hypothetical protein
LNGGGGGGGGGATTGGLSCYLNNPMTGESVAMAQPGETKCLSYCMACVKGMCSDADVAAQKSITMITPGKMGEELEALIAIGVVFNYKECTTANCNDPTKVDCSTPPPQAEALPCYSSFPNGIPSPNTTANATGTTPPVDYSNPPIKDSVAPMVANLPSTIKNDACISMCMPCTTATGEDPPPMCTPEMAKDGATIPFYSGIPSVLAEKLFESLPSNAVSTICKTENCNTPGKLTCDSFVYPPLTTTKSSPTTTPKRLNGADLGDSTKIGASALNFTIYQLLITLSVVIIAMMS